MVPDDCCGRVADDSTLFPNSPAEVNIVPCSSKSRIESADFFERVFLESHVASWNVLCDPVGEQNRIGTGRVSDCLRLPTILANGEVGSANTCKGSILEGESE